MIYIFCQVGILNLVHEMGDAVSSPLIFISKGDYLAMCKLLPRVFTKAMAYKIKFYIKYEDNCNFWKDRKIFLLSNVNVFVRHNQHIF